LIRTRPNQENKKENRRGNKEGSSIFWRTRSRDWLCPEEIPTHATKEEKEAIKQHNKEQAEEVRQYRERQEKQIKEREEDTKRYHKELKTIGKSRKVEEYLKSEHKDLYREEYEELRKLQTRKGKLGKDELTKKYADQITEDFCKLIITETWGLRQTNWNMSEMYKKLRGYAIIAK